MKSVGEKSSIIRKNTVYAFCFLLILWGNLHLWQHRGDHLWKKDIWMHIYMQAPEDTTVDLFYGDTPDTLYGQVPSQTCEGGTIQHQLAIRFPLDAKYIGLCFQRESGELTIHRIELMAGNKTIVLKEDWVDSILMTPGISEAIRTEEGTVLIRCGDGQSMIVLPAEEWNIPEEYYRSNRVRLRIYVLLRALIWNLLGITGIAYLRKKEQSVQQEPEVLEKTELYEVLLVAAVFLICLGGAYMTHEDNCPDEGSRKLLTDYICEQGRLPMGTEPETIIPGWGFSYALRPYLPAIVNALFRKITMLFTSNKAILRMMGRMCSVLSLTGSAWFLLKTGKDIFGRRSTSLLMTVLVCFMPQVLFLGMYENTDSLSLFVVCMESYFLVRGHKNGWRTKDAIGLALAFSIGLLSYYTIYPWLLFGGVFFLVSAWSGAEKEKKAKYMIERIAVIAGIVLLLSGWFFIKNAILFDGDLFGIRTESVMREALQQKGENVFEYNRGYRMADSVQDMIFLDYPGWGKMTMRSLIGYFGYMNMPSEEVMYGRYYMFMQFALLAGLIATIKKKTKDSYPAMLAYMLASASLVVLLSILQSWYRDYEPQGRYIITVLPLFSMLAAAGERYLFCGEGEEKSRIDVGFLAAIVWIGMFLHIWFYPMERMLL